MSDAQSTWHLDGGRALTLAAGAGELMTVIEKELDRLGVEAHVIPVGCIGMCFAEPLVDIRVPDHDVRTHFTWVIGPHQPNLVDGYWN